MKAYETEVQTLVKVYESNKLRNTEEHFEFAKVLEHGKVYIRESSESEPDFSEVDFFPEQSTLWFFIVMPKFGKNLEKFIYRVDDRKSVGLQIGIQLVR